MTTERKALVLSYVHSELAIRNLDIAVHEARIDKDPDYRRMTDDLKLLKERMRKTFIMINRKMVKDGVRMDVIEDELDDIQDKTWDDPELNK